MKTSSSAPKPVKGQEHLPFVRDIPGKHRRAFWHVEPTGKFELDYETGVTYAQMLCREQDANLLGHALAHMGADDISHGARDYISHVITRGPIVAMTKCQETIRFAKEYEPARRKKLTEARRRGAMTTNAKRRAKSAPAIAAE